MFINVDLTLQSSNNYPIEFLNLMLEVEIQTKLIKTHKEPLQCYSFVILGIAKLRRRDQEKENIILI